MSPYFFPPDGTNCSGVMGLVRVCAKIDEALLIQMGFWIFGGTPNFDTFNIGIINWNFEWRILEFQIWKFWISIWILEYHLLEFLVAVATQYLLGSVHVSVCLCVASKFCIVNDSPGRWLPPKRKPKWKMTSPKMEDNLTQNVRRPKMEDDQTRKTTKYRKQRKTEN